MKTIVVTGATSGLGLEASAQLARQGHRVVLVGRDAKRTARALDEVRRRAADAAVDSVLGDLASQRSTRALAAEVLDRFERIDVLVNNAGTVFDRRTLTEDGIEATFATNHLGGFLLTALLRDRIVASAPARVVNVSSVAHYGGTMDFDDLGFEQGYSIMRAYGRSKLANVLFTRHLAAELEGTGVTVNAVHPGVVATRIWNRAPWFARPVLAVAKRTRMISPAVGAERIVYVATSPEIEGVSGEYFEDDVPKRPSRTALDDAVAERLWAESRRLVGLS